MNARSHARIQQPRLIHLLSHSSRPRAHHEHGRQARAGRKGMRSGDRPNYAKPMPQEFASYSSPRDRGKNKSDTLREKEDERSEERRYAEFEMRNSTRSAVSPDPTTYRRPKQSHTSIGYPSAIGLMAIIWRTAAALGLHLHMKLEPLFYAPYLHEIVLKCRSQREENININTLNLLQN